MRLLFWTIVLMLMLITLVGEASKWCCPVSLLPSDFPNSFEKGLILGVTLGFLSHTAGVLLAKSVVWRRDRILHAKSRSKSGL